MPLRPCLLHKVTALGSVAILALLLGYSALRARLTRGLFAIQDAPYQGSQALTCSSLDFLIELSYMGSATALATKCKRDPDNIKCRTDWY
eukprot:1095889-Amphidinium_carterae.1